MSEPTGDLDVDLERADLRDHHGNRVTPEYVQRALADILDENIPVVPSDVRPGPTVAVGREYSSPTG